MALLVAARTFRGSPAPGWHGAGLVISAALAAMGAGAAGLLASYRSAGAAQLAFLTLFLAGSATVFWLQPGGAGLVGALAGVGLMARWLPVRMTAVPVGLTMAAIAAAAVADRANHPVPSVLLAVAGLAAIYGVALLTRRLGEGNLQAERLLAELEQTRGAEVRAAALAERQRLAREIHDVLAPPAGEDGCAGPGPGRELRVPARPGGTGVTARAHDDPLSSRRPRPAGQPGGRGRRRSRIRNGAGDPGGKPRTRCWPPGASGNPAARDGS